MLKLEKENMHPRDKIISFDEEPHIYYVDGDEYKLSVTSFVHSFFGKFEPQKIVDKFYDRWQADDSSKYFNMSKEDIIKSWEDNGKLQSGLGTKMHLAIENFYNGIKIDEISPELIQFTKFYKDHKHYNPYRTEWMVYAKELKLAGSIDMVFEEEESGVLHIYDWKRSKEIREQNKFQEGKYPLAHLPDTNYWHYSLQLNCYKYILENYYDKKVEDLYLVVLHPNNKEYIKLKCADLQEEVKLIFDIRKEDLKNK